MKRLTTFTCILTLALTAASCHKKALRGEGPDVSERREISDFNKLEANGSHDITIVKDNETYVIVSGYSNLVAAYDTRISGDRLILEMNDRFWNIKNDNIKVEVHTPYVDRLSLNGSGSITLHSGFQQDFLTADIDGSGDITVSNNTYKSTSIDINGSGSCNMETSEAERVTADISGSGDIYVNVKDYLKVKISGSGDVYYRGNPTVETDISGSGKVQKRN